MPWMAVCFLAVPLGGITAFVLGMVQGWEHDRPAVVAILGVFTLPLLAIAALVARIMRPITLTPSALRIPASGFGTVVIPVNDVVGIGLLYHVRRTPDRSPSAWFLYVWRRDGSVQRVNGLVCRKQVDATSSQIGRSRAGRTARRLHNKIGTMQGPTGSLAALELQKHSNVGLADNLLAFWSPDGAMGPTRY